MNVATAQQQLPAMLFISRVFCGNRYINLTYCITSVRKRSRRYVSVHNLK